MAIADEAILSVLEGVQILADLSQRAAQGHPDSAQMASTETLAACLSSPLAGLNLSQRERQLLSLARACIHARFMGTRVILFDEPIVVAEDSDNLDSAFDRMVKEKLDGFTVIVASHRAATLSIIDRVLRLDQGSLVTE